MARELTIGMQISALRQAMGNRGRVVLQAVLATCRSRTEAAVTLLAALELVRRRQVTASQDELFGPITLQAVPGADRERRPAAQRGWPTQPARARGLLRGAALHRRAAADDRGAGGARRGGALQAEGALVNLGEELEARARGMRLQRRTTRGSSPPRRGSGARLAAYAAREEARLTPAALEALAVIAYRQPCTRGEVERVRGVDCDYVHSLAPASAPHRRGRAAATRPGARSCSGRPSPSSSASA